jgi:hypothetical protein
VYFSQTTQANPHREIEEVHSTGQKLPLRFDSKLHVVEYHQRTSRAPSANSQGWDLHISPARLSATSTTSNPVSHRDPRGPNRVNIVDKSEGSVGYTIHAGIPVHKARSVWLRSALCTFPVVLLVSVHPGNSSRVSRFRILELSCIRDHTYPSHRWNSGLGKRIRYGVLHLFMDPDPHYLPSARGTIPACPPRHANCQNPMSFRRKARASGLERYV